MIYFDIDGTLGDFRLQWFFHKNERLGKGERVDCSELKNPQTFTQNMPLAPLGNYLSKRILAYKMLSTKSVKGIIAVTALQTQLSPIQAGKWIAGRRAWMEHYFADIPIFLTYGMKFPLCSGKSDLLVDDSGEERRSWRARGGAAMTPEEFLNFARLHPTNNIFQN